jgi:hypothetical protein
VADRGSSRRPERMRCNKLEVEEGPTCEENKCLGFISKYLYMMTVKIDDVAPRQQNHLKTRHISKNHFRNRLGG